MSTPTTSEGAAVRVRFPPLLFGGPLAVTLALHHLLLPLPLPGLPAITLAGAALVVAGMALSLSGVATVLRHRTTVVPHHAVSRLVTAGPYRVSRNPMYTGLTVAYVGAALWAGSWWPLVVAPLCVLATLRLVILAEERYLGERFGAEYVQYRSLVRRWL